MSHKAQLADIVSRGAALSFVYILLYMMNILKITNQLQYTVLPPKFSLLSLIYQRKYTLHNHMILCN